MRHTGIRMVSTVAAALVSFTAAATASAAPSSHIASPAAYSSCGSGDFCAWSGPNGTGTKKAWYICQTVSRPFSTSSGSYYNNQTGGAEAILYTTAGGQIVVNAGQEQNTDWNEITRIKTC
jgi:hypothetical protein